MNAPRPKLDIDRTRDRLIQLGLSPTGVKEPGFSGI